MDNTKLKSYLSIRLGIFVEDIDNAIHEHQRATNAPFFLSKRGERNLIVEALCEKYKIPSEKIWSYINDWRSLTREPTYLFDS